MLKASILTSNEEGSLYGSQSLGRLFSKPPCEWDKISRKKLQMFLRTTTRWAEERGLLLSLSLRGIKMSGSVLCYWLENVWENKGLSAVRGVLKTALSSLNFKTLSLVLFSLVRGHAALLTTWPRANLNFVGKKKHSMRWGGQFSLQDTQVPMCSLFLSKEN